MLKYNANVENTSAKNAEKCIAISYYKCKFSLFGRDDTRQAGKFSFIVVSQGARVPKEQKKPPKN